MATGGQTRSADRQIGAECSVCLEFLDTDQHLPLSLDCRHDVCQKCTPGLLRGSQIICHTCRRPTDVPGGDVSKLPKNYGLIDMLQQMCVNCGRKWTAQCTSCKIKFCNKCLELHTVAHNLQDVMKSALNPAKEMEVHLDKAEKDARSLYDSYIAAAMEAQETTLAEIRQVRQDNQHMVDVWQDGLSASLMRESKQLMDKLENLKSNFNKRTVDDLKKQTADISKKLSARKPDLKKGVLQIHNNLTATIADSAELKLTKAKSPQYKVDSAEMKLVTTGGPDYSKARVKHEVGGEGEDLGQFSYPNDVCQVSSGNFIVSDYENDRYQILDPQLKPVSTFGSQGDSAGHLVKPSGVATDSQGRVFVANTDKHKIQVFNQPGQQQHSFGSPGSKPGQFSDPEGLAFDSHNNLYVCDYNNSRVQVLTSRGEYLRTLAVTGDGTNQLRGHPYRVAVTPDDRVVVTDYSYMYEGVGGNLYVFDRSGNHIQTLLKGSNTFESAAGVAADRFGNLLVTDSEAGCIVVFDQSLKRLCKFGVKGQGQGQLQTPVSLTLTQDGDVVVVEQNDHKIVLYEMP